MTHDHSYLGQAEAPDFGGMPPRAGNSFQNSRASASIDSGEFQDVFRHGDPPYRPLENRILVRRAPTQGKIGSIFIPEELQEKYAGGSTWEDERSACELHGTVIAVGPGYSIQGRRWPIELQVGDEVYFGPHAKDGAIPEHPDLLLMQDYDALVAFRNGKMLMVRDHILIEKDQASVKTHVEGVEIPEIARLRPQEGTVRAVGRGKILEKSGTLVPTEVEVGDKVMFQGHHGIDVRLSEGVFLVIREEDILGVV